MYYRYILSSMKLVRNALYLHCSLLCHTTITFNLDNLETSLHLLVCNNPKSFFVSKGCILLNTTKIEVTKSAGESALLPCSCTDLSAKPEMFRWLRDGVELSPSKLGAYSGRVQMFHQDSPGNLSMLISDLTRTDEGSYRCEAKSSRDIFLRIEGWTFIDRITDDNN